MIYRLNHWIDRNFWRWLPAALIVGIVLACAAHERDTPRFVAPVDTLSSSALRN
jgi:hypothetical protein